MYGTKQAISSAIGVTGLALATLGTMGTAPASAAATCQLSVDSVKVLNLQDGDGDDEIFLKLGSQKTPRLSYVLGQKRNNIGTEAFQNSIDVKVFERDGANITRVGTINNVPCVNNPGQITDLAGSGAVYRLRWSVA